MVPAALTDTLTDCKFHRVTWFMKRTKMSSILKLLQNCTISA